MFDRRTETLPTQDMVNAVQRVAQLRSEAYLDQLKGTADRSIQR